MKKVFVGLFLVLLTSVLWSQKQENNTNHFSVGFKLQQVKNDFGFGAELTSPFFLKNRMAVRANYSLSYFEHYSAEAAGNVWSPYSVFRLGFVGVGGRPAPFLRLYGEGGFLLGLPDGNFATQNNFFGAYGHFGFEFFMSESAAEHTSYYIELGGTGSGSEANTNTVKTNFYNGFTMATGFRFYL